MTQASAEDIEYFFRLAIEQYAEINLIFLFDQCPYSRLTGICVGVKSGHFIVRVDLDKIENHPLVWGTETNCYFVVRDTDLVACHFVTRLARIYNAPPQSMFLVFPLPLALDHNQRRFGRRVTLFGDEENRPQVWHGFFRGGDNATLPELRWEDVEKRGCVLEDISANGMRLRVSDKNPYYPKLQINDRLLMRGDFGSPKKPLQIYALGSVSRKMPLPETEDDVAVGCQFISWRKTDDDKTWFRVDPQEGIPALSQWISRNFRSLK